MIDNFALLVKDDVRLACVSYLQKNIRDYSITLLSFLEDLPVQLTRKEEDYL